MIEKPTILVIFGMSGDLAKRYLLPAIEELRGKGLITSKFELIGASRKDYHTLEERLRAAEEAIGESGGGSVQKLFHLAIPTKVVGEVVEFLHTSGLSKGDVKLILEKPFGSDLESAKALVDNIAKYFREDQVYRIDHYLARDTAQNILKQRQGDGALEQIWNKNFIKSIEIIASEKIDIEGRVNFYEQTGALRDFLQSHLLELAALVLMKLPDGTPPRELRFDALRNLDVVCDITKHECVKRGQYEGYRSEVENEESLVETFVSVNMVSNDPIWRGVPITLITGKALREKYTIVRIKFKDREDLVFNLAHDALGRPVNGYVQALYGAIAGETDLSASSEEVLESWRILDAIQKTWENGSEDLIIYKKGSAVENV